MKNQTIMISTITALALILVTLIFFSYTTDRMNRNPASLYDDIEVPQAYKMVGKNVEHSY